ncbi:MAG TPA: mechanosensitive ion channel family protein [Acholeplasmataceae bacterium]|nr:mechanosensitive ion channel family protein [Acholeplasmataceae bacterium]HRX44471.1 mechanosensitive ion channel family protein [Acholeplasmataceae bacterium]
MNFKDKSKQEKVRLIVLGSIIVLFILLGSLADVIFPNTTFSNIINQSIGKFFNMVKFVKNEYVTILESLTIFIFVWVLNHVLLFLVNLLTKKGHRGETVGKLMASVIRYMSFVVAFFLVLSAWGVETPTLLAGAGIIGLGLSFGAQSLIEDIIAGLFIIFEKQFVVGHIVEINDRRGIVREIGIRTTKIEDLNGDVLIINNSDIRGIINTSIELSTAISDVGIEYSEDIHKVEALLQKNLVEMKKKIPEIIEGPYYMGVEALADSSVVVRLQARCDEINKNRVRRAMNREIKLLFDQEGINIPFNQIVVHEIEEKS